jgi:hypothetical protein
VDASVGIVLQDSNFDTTLSMYVLFVAVRCCSLLGM